MSLTFDDGPTAIFTPQVLRLLSAAHAPAVFCLIGAQALALPELVAQESNAGALCDHSRDHNLRMRVHGSAYEQREVTDGLQNLRRADPAAPVAFYRQPGGLWDRTIVRAMYGAGLAPLRWSDDPRDWSRPGTVTIAQRVLDQLRSGSVILLHDGGGDRTQTVQALTWLLHALPAAGWHFTLPTVQHLPDAAAARPQ